MSATTFPYRPARPRVATNRVAANRVAIIGGGIIGLSIGWRLAAAGCSVDVFERDAAGRGASWAAAGMLAAVIETEPAEEGLLPLSCRSRDLWPDFARELEAASGQEIGYRDEGTLVVALTRDDAEQLRFNYDLQQRLGLDVEWLAPGEALRREPALAPRLAAACFSPRDHQVDNRRVVTALAEAFRRAGGTLHEQAAIEGIDIEAGVARGVVLAGEHRPADVVVLAAGAWSREIAGLPPSALPPVRPIKGQMLSVWMPPAAPLLRHVVWGPRTYLAPRREGKLVVGATVEERGFDAALTAGGVLALLEAAWPDDAPILGPSAVEGLVLACGHHRHGILLAPVTAEAIADLVLTGEVPETIRAFGIDRFQTRPAASQERAPS
jgi:glycine oxidase